jgi:hypothetical protein
MKLFLAMAIILPVLSCPQPYFHQHEGNRRPPVPELINYINDISLPEGFTRSPVSEHSFAAWLRLRPLKKDKTVYLYNGMPKRNQLAQYAVLDISVGEQDLQQCADAIMRLRAEYLYERGSYNQIIFTDNAAHAYTYKNGRDRKAFNNYLRTVFAFCGTASLEKQLKPVNVFYNIQPGDVFIQGGFPGHAVMVMDVAQNGKGEKIYLLCQSYMPAQDIHLLKNPTDPERSPWYKVIDNHKVITPEWTFAPAQLRRW